MSDLTCAVTTSQAELERLRPAWRELLADSATDEPTLSPEWLLSWWQVFGDGGRRLSVALFRDVAGRLVGLAPLLRRRHWHLPGIPFRRLEPLGSGEREADAVCSEYLNVIGRRGWEEAVARGLAGALVGGALGGWDELVLPHMDGSGPMPELLASALRAAGATADLSLTGEAPFIPLPHTWEAYLKALPGRHRYQIKRSLRDFDGWAGDEARLEEVTGPANLERGKEVLLALHGERWQAERPGGVFGSERFRAFHDLVMPLLLREGALQLLWLSVGGRPVAALYNVVWGGKVSFYQCGRRLDVPAGVRVGSVLLAHAIRRAIEKGQREFDFLGGPSLYKGQFALAHRPLVTLRAARRSLVEGARRLAEAGRASARALRRRLRRNSALASTDRGHFRAHANSGPVADEKSATSLD